MRYSSVIGIAFLVGLFQPAHANTRIADMVDLQLILAVDVSLSIDLAERRLQRKGYVAAFRDPVIVRAIRSGPTGRIAVTYVEWADTQTQKVLVPWMIVGSKASAEAFAQALERKPLGAARRTSISAMLEKAAELFARSGLKSFRRIVDLSGDGPNNSGSPVVPARDSLIRAGVTINGLPIVTGQDELLGGGDTLVLENYFRDCVVGGVGAFVLPIRSKSEFASAIRSKLLLEISGLPPRVRPRVQKAQFRLNGPVVGGGLYRGNTDCMIGERWY